MASAARHKEGSVHAPRQVVWRAVRRGRVDFLPMLLSDLGRMVLVRKYDAVTTDAAYDTDPVGRWGPVGRAVDRTVRRFPVHEGLRQRLALVTDELVAAVEAQGEGPVHVLSAPCGLGRDLVQTARRLGRDDLSLTGIDLDETGEVLDLLQQRARAAGVHVTTHRADLFDDARLDALAVERAHVVNSIGLVSWLDLDDVGRLVRRFGDRFLHPGGTLVVDNFARHKHSDIGRHLEINIRYHDPDEFVAAVEAEGYRLVRRTPTRNGVATVHVFRATRRRAGPSRRPGPRPAPRPASPARPLRPARSRGVRRPSRP